MQSVSAAILIYMQSCNLVYFELQFFCIASYIDTAIVHAILSRNLHCTIFIVHHKNFTIIYEITTHSYIFACNFIANTILSCNFTVN